MCRRHQSRRHERGYRSGARKLQPSFNTATPFCTTPVATPASFAPLAALAVDDAGSSMHEPAVDGLELLARPFGEKCDEKEPVPQMARSQDSTGSASPSSITSPSGEEVAKKALPTASTVKPVAMGRIQEREERPLSGHHALERIAFEGHLKRTAELNQGHVDRASSIASMEQVARDAAAKGVIWERCAHALQSDMEQWLVGQNETVTCFSVEQLFTGGEGTHEADERTETTPPPSKRVKSFSSRSDDTQRKRDVAGPVDIQAACERLVAGLPHALRGPLSRDAKALAEMLLRLCPDAPWLTTSVEVTGARTACTRWHQDKYMGRALISYTGPGTWCVDDASVRYDQFAKTLGLSKEESDPQIVPSFDSIHRPQSNAVVLLKGNDWPDIQGVGVTHKAPNIPPELKRLILKVDLSKVRPDID